MSVLKIAKRAANIAVRAPIPRPEQRSTIAEAIVFANPTDVFFAGRVDFLKANPKL
jgi:hypothetical protein